MNGKHFFLYEVVFWLAVSLFIPTMITAQTIVLKVVQPNGEETWRAGSDQQIEWVSSINNQPARIKIELSLDAGSNWQVIEPSTDNDNSYTWTLPDTFSSTCLVKVSDAFDGIPFDVSDNLFTIEKWVSESTNPTPQPAGSYRLISVPIALDDSSAGAVLMDDLGGYDIYQWRFFDYYKGSSQVSSYKEFGQTRDFRPGRSFFLITEKPVTIDAGPGVLVGDAVVTVPLERGWNLIANPFSDMDIPVTALSHPNNNQLIEYSGNGWSDPLRSPVNILKRWKGYALKVPQNTALQIRRQRVNQPQVLHKPLLSTLPTRQTWAIQIAARCQNAFDTGNYAGVMPGAAEEAEQYDLYEPPPIGAYVRLYFPHREWREAADIYTADFRSPDQKQYRWNFEVSSSIADMVELTFSGLEELPLEMEAWILDLQTGQAQDLRQDHDYHFLNPGLHRSRKFTLLVGESPWIDEQLATTEIAPATYELLPNFPNPFNSATAIRFTLPATEKVTLKVYNLLGQEVATLLNQHIKEAGVHTEYWNGRDSSGKIVASGVYLYRLKAGKFYRTRKMMLLQ